MSYPPPSRWQLYEAKARFSEVFRRALSQGPQWITRQGKDAVVVLPAQEYERLTAPAQPAETLFEWLRRSPLYDSGIELERARDDSGHREIDFSDIGPGDDA